MVRRRIFEFAYNNNTNIDRAVVAANIAREKNKFTVKPARAISIDLVNKFIASWKDIFNVQSVPGGSDHIEIFNKCREFIEQKLRGDNTLLASIASYPFAPILQQVIDKLVEWQAIRDYSAFFEKVVSDSTEAKNIIDDGKRVREFCNDQLDSYKQCCQFATENEANWGDLDSEAHQAAMEFKKILSDARPMQRMPEYLRYRRMLTAKLEDVKRDLRTRIEKAYRETEEQLIGIAKEQGAPYTSNVDNVILIKQQPQNIANLKLNCNTDDYYKEQVAKILSSIPAPPKPSGDTPAPGSQQRTPQPTPIKNIRLSTRSSSKLATAQDVENYLNNLRSQLMRHIDNGEEILVL